MKKSLLQIILVLILVLILSSCARPQNNSQWQNVTTAPEISFDAAGNNKGTETTSEEEPLSSKENLDTNPSENNIEEAPSSSNSSDLQTESSPENTLVSNSPSEEKKPQEQYDGSPVGTFYSIEEFIKTTKKNKNDIAFQPKESGGWGWIYVDHFYLPKLPEDYKLSRILENASVVAFFYNNTKGEEIVVNFKKATNVKKEVLLEEFLNSAKINRLSNAYVTEEGYIYDQAQKQITVLTENSWMNICIPESLNTYEQLKPLCIATRYDVNKGENDSSVIK